MSRLALRLASAAATVATVGIISATPALASPCASGERLTGRTEAGWLCTNIETGVTRLVEF